MSYLDFPRLHFAGSFTADPSTINNVPDNYTPASQQRATLDLSWNPYGSATWAISGRVTSYVDRNGTWVGTGKDAVLKASLQNSTEVFGVSAKLVDLDTDEQTHTRLFGLFLEFTGARGKPLLSGYFEQQGCLKNLWFSRVPNSSDPDAGAGGTFQSVFPVDHPPVLVNGKKKNVNIQWGDVSTSPLLQQLKAASKHGLSVSFSGYGYDDDPSSATFQQGHLVGTIGPARPREPKYKVARRMLSPVSGSSMWNAPAAVDTRKNKLSIDLSNAIPEQSPGGPPIDQGAMWAALLPPGQPPALLGPYDYQNQFEATAGVFLLDVAGQNLQAPLAILTANGPGQPIDTPQGTMYVTLQENKDGVYVTVDQSTVYMNPGEKASVDLYATKFGARLPNYKVPLSLIPAADGNGNYFINNDPPGALTFAASVTTNARGKASVRLKATNPSPKPARRAKIDGQLYFVGGPWSAAFNANSQTPSAFTVKIFNSIKVPKQPTWSKDVGPILYQYYTLYAYMISFFDLSDYASVKGASSNIKKLINLELADPRKMPVTRELSRDAVTLITRWIDQGCPP